MSVEMIRLLLQAGVSSVDVEAVLSQSLETGQSVARVLIENQPELFELLDRELLRNEVASIEIVRPAIDQMAQLPSGLCDRLGVVPVRKDARSGRVDVAALDPVDAHVAAELEFHLAAPVRVLRARPEVIRAALASMAGVRAPSGPPLPLVRRPQSGDQRATPAASLVPGQPAAASVTLIDDADEPVLSLTRPKAAGSRSAAPESAAPRTEPMIPSESLERVLGAFEAAGTADDVVQALLRGTAPARTLVLAVRSGAYAGRAASGGLAPQMVSDVRLAAGGASVVETAARSGFYLGALPHTEVHESLRKLFNGPSEREIYAVSVMASGRPSLVLITELLPLGGSVEATRRADQLAQAAGRALERILVSRKRGN